MSIKLDEQNFNKHFQDLEDLTELLRGITTKEKLHQWIRDWQEANSSVDGDSWLHSFPSVLDISIVEDDTGIWVEKILFLNKMRKISMAVF